MKKITSFILLIAIQTSIHAQLSKEQIVSNKIQYVEMKDTVAKTHLVHYFNSDGNIIMKGTKIDGRTAFTAHYTYNNKNITEERQLNIAGEYLSVTKYYYNGTVLEKKEFVNAKKIKDSIFTYEYDANGNKIKEQIVLASGKKYFITYKYDSGKLIEKEQMNYKNLPAYKTIYSYGSNTLVSKITVQDIIKKTNTEYLFYYDGKDKLIKEEYKSGNDSYTKEYDYQDNGLIKSVKTTDSKGKSSFVLFACGIEL